MPREYSQHFLDTMSIVETPEGVRYRCQLCKALFPHQEITYVQGDGSFTQLCDGCIKKPEAQCFLPSMERLRRGLISRDEIANWNAFHDM